MKLQCLIIALGLVLTGCNGLDRLLHGSDEESAPEAILVPVEPIGETPTFNQPVKEGFRTEQFHQTLDVTMSVAIDPDTHSVYAYIKDVGFWFRLGSNTTQAPFFQRASNPERVIFLNAHEGQEVFVYTYIPEGL